MTDAQKLFEDLVRRYHIGGASDNVQTIREALSEPVLEKKMVNVPYVDGTPSREWVEEPITKRSFHPSQLSDEEIDEVARARYGEPVIDDELREAVECLQFDLRHHPDTYVSIHRKHAETLINHAMKGQRE